MKVTVARVLYLARVVVIAACGAWWIAAHAGGGQWRRSAVAAR